MVTRKRNEVDKEFERQNRFTDLSSTMSSFNNNNSSYSCEFCDCALIEKKDDTVHLGFDYNRLICPKCGFIYDQNIDNEDNSAGVKHLESVRTITDDLYNKPFVEVWSTNSNDNDHDYNDNYYDDPLSSIEPNEDENLRKQGCTKITHATYSSVTGRTNYTEEHL
jgi:hypothetical protein